MSLISGPQQLSPLFISKPQIDAAIRETAKFDIEIYGFPQPRTLTLERTNNDITLTYSPRHSVEYTSGVAPFGVVNVTIFDLVDADYANYTLTVDNGVGNALVYTFYLNEGGTENCVYLSQTFEILLLENDIVMYENVREIIIILIVLSFNLYSVRKLILHSGEHAIFDV